MPANLYNIETIERYLRRQMDTSEQAAFESQLEAEEGYRQEVAAYQQLLEGFDAARSEDFIGKLEGWEAQAEAASDEVELIEWYWNGALQGPGRVAFEERLQQDAGFAAEVAAYRQLFEGFDAARSENFIGKLEGWEKSQTPKPELRVAGRRPLLYRIAAAAAVLLLIGFGLNWYATAYYSNAVLVADYYQAPRSEAIMGANQPGLTEIARQFEQANALFQEKQYPEAYQAFDALLATLPSATLDNFNRRYYREQAEWNRLLAALALDNPPINLKEEVDRIANTEGHEFQPAAQKLSRQLQSVWYKWAN